MLEPNQPADVTELRNILEKAGYETVVPPHAALGNVESRCQYCNAKEDLRFNTCFACADAQAIIGTGKDMYDKGSGGIELPCKESNERLRLLLKNGWRYVPSAHS